MYNVCGTIFSILLLILGLFEETRDAADIIANILRLLPCFTYGYSLVNNTNIDINAYARGNLPEGALAWVNNGVDIFYLGVTSVFYLALVFVVELL